MPDDKKPRPIFCGNAMVFKVPYPPYSQLQFFATIANLNTMMAHAERNGGAVKVNAVRRRQKSKKGLTHYLAVNTYKKPPPPLPAAEEEEIDEDKPIELDF